MLIRKWDDRAVATLMHERSPSRPDFNQILSFKNLNRPPQRRAAHSKLFRQRPFRGKPGPGRKPPVKYSLRDLLKNLLAGIRRSYGGKQILVPGRPNWSYRYTTSSTARSTQFPVGRCTRLK
jgi:hypothetical protein